jgi:hypothetical protein
MDKLVWRKPTFGYIPGHFSVSSGDRVVAFDRLIAIGDAASLQSPLIFTGFGSLVRNLPRLTHLLDDPDRICAFQQYTSLEASQDFLKTDSYAAYLKEVETLIAEPPQFTWVTPVWVKGD